jgi:hypothetical protein
MKGPTANVTDPPHHARRRHGRVGLAQSVASSHDVEPGRQSHPSYDPVHDERRATAYANDVSCADGVVRYSVNGDAVAGPYRGEHAAAPHADLVAAKPAHGLSEQVAPRRGACPVRGTLRGSGHEALRFRRHWPWLAWTLPHARAVVSNTRSNVSDGFS